MVRTQIQLTEEQARRLRRIARQEGISLAAVIRRAVEQALAEPSTRRSELYERASALVGGCRDLRGATDVAAEHDRYLDEALE